MRGDGVEGLKAARPWSGGVEHFQAMVPISDVRLLHGRWPGTWPAGGGSRCPRHSPLVSKADFFPLFL